MPIYPKKESYVHHAGQFFTAEWYYAEDGKLPALDYYRELEVHDRARLNHIIRHLCDSPHGTILPMTLYRVEDRENKIYALKPRDERFFNFTTDGAKVILTNAYHKHSQQMTKADLESLKIAVKYRQDYLKRARGRTYYED